MEEIDFKSFFRPKTTSKKIKYMIFLVVNSCCCCILLRNMNNNAPRIWFVFTKWFSFFPIVISEYESLTLFFFFFSCKPMWNEPKNCRIQSKILFPIFWNETRCYSSFKWTFNVLNKFKTCGSVAYVKWNELSSYDSKINGFGREFN